MTTPFPLIASREDFDLSFKVFHELMARKVTDILLVSNPYEAFIMEEEGRLAERIIHEYRGLNLSRPPMLTWVSTSAEALQALHREKFDLVITMPLVEDTDADILEQPSTKLSGPPGVPSDPQNRSTRSRPQISGPQRHRPRVCLAGKLRPAAGLDQKPGRLCMNVAFDTERAKVRVIIVVEDSAAHYSALLPILYKEIVTQTQAAMEKSGQ